jgi:hypothetical protein
MSVESDALVQKRHARHIWRVAMLLEPDVWGGRASSADTSRRRPSSAPQQASWSRPGRS